jgi:hypothetical protein
MGGVGGSGPPASHTMSPMTAATTSYVSGAAIGGNIELSMAATGCAKVIEHIIMLCGSQDSTMMEYIDQRSAEVGQVGTRGHYGDRRFQGHSYS